MNELRIDPSTVLRNSAARQEEGVDVHPVRVERQVSCLHLLVVDRHEYQVDVGLGPDLVVRQAAAEDRRQDGAVLLHLLDERSSASLNLSSIGSCLMLHRRRYWYPQPVRFRTYSSRPLLYQGSRP